MSGGEDGCRGLRGCIAVRGVLLQRLSTNTIRGRPREGKRRSTSDARLAARAELAYVLSREIRAVPTPRLDERHALGNQQRSAAAARCELQFITPAQGVVQIDHVLEADVYRGQQRAVGLVRLAQCESLGESASRGIRTRLIRERLPSRR